MPSLAVHALTVLALAILLNLASTNLKPYLSSISLVSQNTMSVTPVKLYGMPTSTCTRRVATVLKEKNVPYELVLIDLSKGEHKSPQYVAEYQPFGQVPVLKVCTQNAVLTRQTNTSCITSYRTEILLFTSHALLQDTSHSSTLPRARPASSLRRQTSKHGLASRKPPVLSKTISIHLLVEYQPRRSSNRKPRNLHIIK